MSVTTTSFPGGQVPGSANKNVLDVALAAIGRYPYCWGGSAPPCFDCSGFVYWCFNQVGIPLARAMFQQLNQGETISLGPPGNRLMNALPGDVVYFGLNNPNPAQNHEGIVSSTVGVGTMVQAECTSCGPINLGSIGEGSSSEPISAIRRFTSINIPQGPTFGGTGGSTDSSGATLVDANCMINIPVINFCLMRRTWLRALLGAVFMAGAGGLMITGVILLAASKKRQQQLIQQTPRAVRRFTRPLTPESTKHFTPVDVDRSRLIETAPTYGGE